MVIKTVQTLVFEYPEDYQAEVEWNKKRDGDWVHQSTDTICSVYTLTNNYLIPTKAKHSFVDNPYFEVEPSNSEKPNNCEDEPYIDIETGILHWCGWKYKRIYEDEPQYEMGMGTLKCDNCSEYGSFKCAKCDGEMYFKRLEPKGEPQKWETPPKFEHKEFTTTCVSVPAWAITERYCTNCKHNGVLEDYECRECHGMDKHEFIEPQTDCAWKNECK